MGFLYTVDSVDLGVGLVRVSRKGRSICSWEFYGEFDVWIYGIEVLLKFADLILPGGTVDIINIPEPPFD